MIIIDLDNFKSVNDAGGYELGDAVLGEFAARLKEQCRGIDRVFRYKMGDEFLILLPTHLQLRARGDWPTGYEISLRNILSRGATVSSR